MGTQHRVQRGETLQSIAKQYGFRNWQSIANHPKNASLFREDGEPNLLPSDVDLYIPDKNPARFVCATNQAHRFQLKRVTAMLRVVLAEPDGTPLGDVDYEIKIGEQTVRARSAAGGEVCHEVPEAVERVDLTAWPEGGPEEGFRWTFDLRPMPSIDRIEGIQARLNHLGYACGDIDGQLNEATKEAIAEFQDDIGYDEPTGEIDDETRRALLVLCNEA